MVLIVLQLESLVLAIHAVTKTTKESKIRLKIRLIPLVDDPKDRCSPGLRSTLYRTCFHGHLIAGVELN
jgi:hypothetical protein